MSLRNYCSHYFPITEVTFFNKSYLQIIAVYSNMKSLAFLIFISISSCLAKFGEFTNETAKNTTIESGNHIFTFLGQIQL